MEANAPDIEEDAEYCSHLPLHAARPLSGAGNNAGSAWAASTQGAARAQQHLGDDDSVAPAAYNRSSTESTQSPLPSVKTELDTQQNVEISHREEADQIRTMKTEATQNKKFPTDGSKHAQMEARQENDQLHDCKTAASPGQLAPGSRRFKRKEPLPDTC